MSDCTYSITVGRTVITSISPFGGAAVADASPAFPMTLDVACQIVGIARQTGRNMLSKYKERFDKLEAPYMPNGARIITQRDLETLRAMFPVRKTMKSRPPRSIR